MSRKITKKIPNKKIKKKDIKQTHTLKYYRERLRRLKILFPLRYTLNQKLSPGQRTTITKLWKRYGSAASRAFNKIQLTKKPRKKRVSQKTKHPKGRKNFGVKYDATVTVNGLHVTFDYPEPNTMIKFLNFIRDESNLKKNAPLLFRYWGWSRHQVERGKPWEYREFGQYRQKLEKKFPIFDEISDIFELKVLYEFNKTNIQSLALNRQFGFVFVGKTLEQMGNTLEKLKAVYTEKAPRKKNKKYRV